MNHADILSLVVVAGLGYVIKLLRDLKASLQKKPQEPDATIAKGGDGGEEGGGR